MFEWDGRARIGGASEAGCVIVRGMSGLAVVLGERAHTAATVAPRPDCPRVDPRDGGHIGDFGASALERAGPGHDGTAVDQPTMVEHNRDPRRCARRISGESRDMVVTRRSASLASRLSSGRGCTMPSTSFEPVVQLYLANNRNGTLSPKWVASSSW